LFNLDKHSIHKVASNACTHYLASYY